MAGAGVSVLLLELLTNISLFQNLKTPSKRATVPDCRANKHLHRGLKDKKNKCSGARYSMRGQGPHRTTTTVSSLPGVAAGGESPKVKK